MPLYSELGYYISANPYSPSNRSPISISPYSPYSRLNPYTPPRSIYAKDNAAFKPMLTAISESPLQSYRPNGFTSLTRINSGGGITIFKLPEYSRKLHFFILLFCLAKNKKEN